MDKELCTGIKVLIGGVKRHQHFILGAEIKDLQGWEAKATASCGQGSPLAPCLVENWAQCQDEEASEEQWQLSRREVADVGAGNRMEKPDCVTC